MSNELDGPIHALLLDIRDGVRQVRERVDILGGLAQLGAQVAAIGGKIDVVITKEDAIMGAVEDANAKVDAIVALVNKVGEDLATEIAAVGAVPAGGIPAADATALLGRLQSVADQLTSIDATMPVPPTA
jgi:hypothetical protein